MDIINYLKERNKYFNNTYTDHYKYDNNSVPRVTEILSAMLHEDYLMYWSNSLGFKRLKYKAVLEEAASKGTYSHKAIEEYLNDNKLPNLDDIPIIARNTVDSTFSAFMKWWNIINTHNVELVYSEKTMTCDLFGGTLDLLLKIDGKYWLIDFKTSNHLNYKYYIQLSAYSYMLSLEKINIDGCLILMLDKENYSFTEYILDLSNELHYKFFNDCKDAFMSIVLAYNERLNIQSQFNDIFKK